MIVSQQILWDHYEPQSDYTDVFHCGLSLGYHYIHPFTV